SAARQQVRGGPAPGDPRDRFAELLLADGRRSLTLAVPEPWHPRSAVIELVASDEEGVKAIAGPRSEDGRAFLAVVPVLPSPTRVIAARMDTPPALDGALDEWRQPPATLVESLHGEPWPPSETEVWFAWDDDHLYVAGRVVD